MRTHKDAWMWRLGALALVALVALGWPATAGATPPPKGLDNGGYGAVAIMTSDLGDATGLLNGAHGSWIIDHTFAVGLFAYGISNVPRVTVNGANTTLNGGYGGLSFEVTPLSEFPIHPVANVMIGVGGLHLDYPVGPDDHSAIVLWNPTLGLEVNPLPWLRLDVLLGQRLMLRNTLDGLGGDDLNATTFGGLIKFGSF